MGDDLTEPMQSTSTVFDRPHPGTEGDSALSTAVLYAIASAKGVDVLELHTPLNDVIDPDALDRLFVSTPDGRAELSFDYEDVRVTVGSDGEITVDG